METTDETDANRTRGAVLLSCQSCRKRKIKCDKQQPCSACVSARKECIPIVRPRHPRGRNGGRKTINTELRNRVNRLEGLVQSLNSSLLAEGGRTDDISGTVRAAQDYRMSGFQKTSISPPPRQAIETRENTPDTTRWMGSTLWTQLAHELNGIHTFLDAEDEDGDDDDFGSSPPSTTTPEQAASPEQALLFKTQSGTTMPETSEPMLKEFSNLYKRNVDPVLKFLHIPSFDRLLMAREPYLGYPAESPFPQALISAACYACICSISNSQCLSTFGRRKEPLRDQWRQAAEHNLAKAELTKIPNIVSLQALMMYIVALRSHDNGQQSWMLVALAVRTAQAMSLHREESYRNMTFFQAQVHRRAWYTILAHDYQAAFDRGSDILIPENGYSTKPPENMDDVHLTVENSGYQKPAGVFSSMTFFTIHCESTRLLRRINWVAPGDADRPPTPIQGSWEVRQQAILDLERHIEQEYLSDCKEDNLYHFACLIFAQMLSKCMQLYALRPLQRHPGLTLPPSGSINILLLATEALEVKEVLLGEMTEPFHWIIKGFVDWQSMAVLLAELCADHDDAQLVERAWKVADSSFEMLSGQIAEGTQGALWRPMRRLMRSAQRKRHGSLAGSSSITGYESAQVSKAPEMAYADINTNVTAAGQVDVMDAGWSNELFDPMQTSWMNWQVFTDDLAQSNDFGWTEAGLETVFNNL